MAYGRLIKAADESRRTAPVNPFFIDYVCSRLTGIIPVGLWLNNGKCLLPLVIYSIESLELEDWALKAVPHSY
jgi:hypothetical protein